VCCKKPAPVFIKTKRGFPFKPRGLWFKTNKRNVF